MPKKTASPKKPTKRDRLHSRAIAFLRAKPVTLVILISVALGLTWLFRARPFPFSDYYDYYVLARDVLDEHQFGYPLPTARRLPAYPALLSGALSISRSFLWLGFLNVLLTAALLPLVYRLTHALTENKRAALAAVAFCAVNPTFAFFSPILASEHLFVVFFFGSLVALFQPHSRATTRAVLTGVLLGLAVLTRGEAVFYIPVVLFAAWTALGSGLSRRARLASTALVLGVCIAVTLPWAVRNRIVMGPGVGLSTVAGMNFYFAHNSTQYGYYDFSETPLAGLEEIEQHHRGLELGWAYLSAAPSRLFTDIAAGTPQLLWDGGSYAVRAGLTVREARPPYTIVARKQFPFGSIWSVTWIYRAFLTIAVVGLILIRRTGWRAMVILYGTVVMNWICYSVVFWSKPRFRYTTEVVFCIIAGIVVLRIWELVRGAGVRSGAES